METLITTEYSHQYIYSDVLCYFLYVPEKMKIADEERWGQHRR